MLLRSVTIGIAVAASSVLLACASSPDAHDSAIAEEAERCHFDETWSCVERMGHAERCFCADKDTLRELLEPTVR